MYFTFIFSGCITITSSEEGLKVCEYNFFQRKVVLLVIYLFNHDSSKSTTIILNMAFDVLLSAVFVKCYQENCPPENCYLWIFPPLKAPNCENYPPEICPQENCPLGKLPPMKSPPHLKIIQMKEKTILQKFLPWRKLCNTISLSK